MWLFYIAGTIAAHLWQTGSLLLPCMLLVLWVAARSKGFQRLTISRLRWLSIWGCLGFGQAIIVALLSWRSHDFPPFDSLGWAWIVVSSTLYALRVRTMSIAVDFGLGLAVRAVGEAVVFGAASAIAWWLYTALTRGITALRRSDRWGVCWVLSASLLGILNSPMFWRSDCSDCFAPHGVPFTYFHEGGYAGGEGFVWLGVLGNLTVIVILATAAEFVWTELASQTPD